MTNYNILVLIYKLNLLRINNCVGERNQKYFIQFLVYVGALAIYAIILVIISWIYDCPQCNNDIATKQNRMYVSIFLECSLQEKYYVNNIVCFAVYIV